MTILRDLETQIMDCWSIAEQLDTLSEGVGDFGMTEDEIINCLIGMRELYSIKFTKLFSTYEQLIAEGRKVEVEDEDE